MTERDKNDWTTARRKRRARSKPSRLQTEMQCGWRRTTTGRKMQVLGSWASSFMGNGSLH